MLKEQATVSTTLIGSNIKSTQELRNTETDLRVPFLRATWDQNASLLEERNYGIAWTQNQNERKISNNLNHEKEHKIEHSDTYRNISIQMDIPPMIWQFWDYYLPTKIQQREKL